MIESGGSISVEINYTTPKDIDDTEVFLSTYPADSVTVTINDRTQSGVEVGASAIHPARLTKLSCPPDAGITRFELKKHILPQQGIQFWWNRRTAAQVRLPLAG